MADDDYDDNQWSPGEFDEVVLQFRVVGGAELPKTDIFTELDPYCKVIYDNVEVARTRTVKNCKDPQWDEDFYIEVPRDSYGNLCGVLRLELYDENRTRQHEYIGCVEMDLMAEVPPDCADPDAQQRVHFLDYDLTYRNDKRGEKLAKQKRLSRLTVALLGVIPSFAAYMSRLGPYADEMGLLADEDSKQIYVPLPEGEGAGLWGGIHYELPRAVSFKLVSTSKEHVGLHLDFKCSKARSLKVVRTAHQAHRLRLLKGLRVYAEATLTHLPLSTDLRKLLLTATPRRAVASCPVADLLQKGAYPGLGCSYKKAARDMGGRAGGALVDPDGSCVYLPVGKAPHSALLQLDFAPRQGAGQGGGPALRVVTVKGQAAGSSGGRSNGSTGGSSRALVHDFATKCDVSCSATETHRKPIGLLKGEYESTRLTELPGALDPKGGDDSPLDTAVIVYYSLEDEPLASCRFGELFEPPPPPEEDDGPSLADAFDPNNVPGSMGSMAFFVAARGGKVVGKVVGQLGGMVANGLQMQTSGSAGSGAAGENKVLGLLKAPFKKLIGDKNAQSGGEESDRG